MGLGEELPTGLGDAGVAGCVTLGELADALAIGRGGATEEDVPPTIAGLGIEAACAVWLVS
jgi:hypothetical protein